MRCIILTTLCLWSCFVQTVESSEKPNSGPIFFVNDLKPSSESISSEFPLNKLTSDKLITFFVIGSDGTKLAEDFVGLTDTYFYAISNATKQQTGTLYNNDIANQILSINENTQSLSKRTHRAADFVSQILTQLTVAVNQLIVDSSSNADPSVIQADHAQIQNVVNTFKREFPDTLCHPDRKIVRKAVRAADKALQSFADNIEVYVDQLNQLVFQSSSGSQQLISSHAKLVSGLRKFAQTSAIAAYLATSKKG